MSLYKGRNTTRLVILAAAASTLAMGVVMSITGKFEPPSTYVSPDLRKILYVKPSGWEVQDIPLGNTEMLRQAVERTLRYDDYFFREYRSGNIDFSIYVAFWAPGKQPPQLIAQHTPDKCWTVNGWTCTEMRFNQQYEVGGVKLWPAQWRKFRSPAGEDIYTVFWHIIGDRQYDYGERFYETSDAVTYAMEALRFFVGSKHEQFFIRVSSNVPPEKIWGEAGFQEVAEGLLKLGLQRHS